MLFSIALAPGVLDPSAAREPSLVRSLASVLHAVAQNGVLLSCDLPSLKSQIVRVAAAATGSGAQRLQVVAAEIAKDDRYSASAPSGPPGTGNGGNPCAQCVTAARWGRGDAVVVLDEGERQQCIGAGAPPDRIVLLNEFAGSPLDVRRMRWLSTQRLDNLTHGDARTLVGGAVRFAKRIVVADKMLAVSAKNGVGKAEKHLAGVAYLVDAWCALSPHAETGRLDVELVSVAGHTGGRAGFIDPAAASSVIERALARLVPGDRVGVVRVTLKQDGELQIFNDRLLVCDHRAWGIQHGLDDLGRLGRPGRRRPTMIDPPSDARGTVFRDIQALRDA